MVYLNKNMKKILAYIYSFLLLTIPFFIFAQTPPVGERLDVGLKNPLNATSVAEVMKSFFDILVELGAVAVVLAIIYAGFLFVVARGNPDELNKAKTTLFWTILGSLVLLGAQIIASVIENTLKKI
jgi:hypothetical protein